MSMSMYVGNLPFSVDQSALQAIFEPFGEVVSAKVMFDRETGRSRGFGFVEMEGHEARAAIGALNGLELRGRQIKVNEERPAKQRAGGGRHR